MLGNGAIPIVSLLFQIDLRRKGHKSEHFQNLKHKFKIEIKGLFFKDKIMSDKFSINETFLKCNL